MTQAKFYQPCKIFFAVVGVAPATLVAYVFTSDGRKLTVK
jgi:hypothetical protein